MSVSLILDTDIGTDVDDCLALAFILGSPEFDLHAVTCVYGDVALRARMVSRLLHLAGRPEIPVMRGVGETLLGVRDIYWEGHEGAGLLDGNGVEDTRGPGEHAVDYLVREIMANPGRFHLLAIGPLTNVALAVRREPRLLDHLAGFTIMGGVFRGPGTFDLPYAEHNIRCDPEAAQVVLAAANARAYELVPLDVTTRVFVREADLATIRARGTAFHDAVAQQLELYPRFARQRRTMLHDPLAAAVVLRPELVTWHPMRVEVETQGRIASAVTFGRTPEETDAGRTGRVALAVDTAAAESFVIARIAGQPAAVPTAG